jgi:Mlc titration factor MtfA (ptsG expression regulator)
MAEANINRRDARRQRAAVRLQTSGPLFSAWNSQAQERLETRLTEFVGLCRNGGVSPTNIDAAAENVLASVAKVMGSKNHLFWLTRFKAEARQAVYGKDRSR